MLMNSEDSVVPMVNYSYVFDFEEGFDNREKRDWMVNNWKVCFYYVGIYMILIFGGQNYMQGRPRFELRRVLAGWNILLALFSIIGTIRTLPEIVHVLSEYGFQYSVCNPSYVEQTKVSGFWTWMFILSKVPELGDTVFIVLRKQPLIFLHWYHHVSVLVYAWYSFAGQIAPARWFIVMNYTVHSFMYSYYALKAMRFSIPRPVSMVITTAQLAQMGIGLYVNWWAHQALARGEKCQITYDNIKIGFVMYFSYFVLFARFFYKAYMPKKDGKTVRAKEA